MLTFLGRRPAARPRVLSERGQGLAVLLGAVAALLWIALRAKGLA